MISGEKLAESDLKRKQIWWSNDKTIIELAYRKISLFDLFVSVSQITTFCSTFSKSFIYYLSIYLYIIIHKFPITVNVHVKD